VQRATNYVLAAVLFAAVLFFAGMSTRLSTPPLRRILLGFAVVLFVGTVAWIATSPISISI
jgi:membrane associated rhomboid family serine protease